MDAIRSHIWLPIRPLVAALAALLAFGAATADAMYFRSAGCMPAYRAERTNTYYSPERRAETFDWEFQVHQRAVRLRPPVSWRMDPYNSPSFRLHLQQMYFLDSLIWISQNDKFFSDSMQREALGRARDLAIDWVRAANGGEVPAEAWSERVAAIRSAYIAYVARASACKGMLSGGQEDLLRRALRRHERVLRRAHYNPNNQGMSINMGLAWLARYLPNDDYIRRGGRIGRERYLRAFHRGYQEREGVWLEHSPGYYRYALGLVEKWLEMVDPNDQELQEAHAEMKRSLAWFTMPDGRFVQFGDTKLMDAPGEVQDTARAQTGLWVAPRSGYAVVKAPGSWFGIASAFHSQTHKHNDELSFDLYESGQRVVSDSGKYDNHRPRYFRFQRSARAHSTLIVDRTPFDYYKRQPYGSGLIAWGQGDGWYAVWARNPLVRSQGVRHQRLFLYKPGEALVVADRTRSRGRHTFTRFFQLGPTIGTDPTSSLLRLTSDGFAGTLRSTSTAGSGRLNRVQGSADPLNGWTFPDYRARRARTTVSWTTAGRDVDNYAAFDLDGWNSLGIKPAALNPDASSIILTNAGSQSKLRVTRSHRQLTVNEVGL